MFLELTRQRTSVRKYLQRPVEPATVDLLVEAALRAPCSRGIISWHFVVVSDPDLLAELSQAKPHGSSFLAGAPLGVVVCADPGKGDTWVEDAAIATTFLHLAAASLRLGSCWIQIRGRNHDPRQTASAYVKHRLGIPEKLEVEAILAVGYPIEEPEPPSQEALPLGRVSCGRFGRSR